MNKLKYTMIIQWSEEENCYIVGFHDFIGQKWRTHGDSYQEAVSNGVEVLELLIEDYQLAGEPLPIPKVHQEQVA
ncbi:MAG: type II toxin-antitoxin system HicB family antitoxin [Microcystaceae cyanobacterium]